MSARDEDEDDLFGSGADEMDGVQSTESPAQSPGVSDDDAQMEVEERHKSVVIPRHATSHVPTKVAAARVPAFLRVDPALFDAEQFLETHKTAEDMALEENSLRWKFTAAEAGAQHRVTKMSNARIVEWEDGSRTLQVGNEQFEVRSQAPFETTFVCVKHPQVLETTGLVDETLTFLPSSTSSATHRKLAEALARKQQSGQVKIGAVFKAEDPDKVRRDVERAEIMKERSRRKLAAQRDEAPISYTDRSFVASSSAQASQSPVEADSGDEDLAALADSGSEGEEEDDEERTARLERAKESVEPEDSSESKPDQRAASVSDHEPSRMSTQSSRAQSAEPGTGSGPIRRRIVLDDEDSE